VPVDLHDLFLNLQAQLASRLQSHRAVLDHPGAKGFATEESWRQMLEEYLPGRYCVSKAFVIDADGGRSHEIDLVIHDRQYSPFLFKQDGAVFIPAESVYAVFEIKQTLDSRNIAYAIDKAASVRGRKRTSAAITHAGGTYSPRAPFRILAGLLCFKSGKDSRLGEPLGKSLGKGPEEGRLDLLCVLQNGAVEANYSAENRVTLDVSSRDSALIFFFLRLLERLQALGTAPAIDLREYGKALGR
jgi:uncharacterized protein DUF6602